MHPHFEDVYDLMVTSFPSSERRTYEDQKALLNKSNYEIKTNHDNKGNLLDIKDFITTDENGNTVLDSTKVDDEVLEAIGFRIPTQGFNSMAYMKIVGFLPKGVVNTIIAPREFIAQMGSDFDIDKLYNDFNATIYEDGKIRRLNNSDLSTYKKGEEYKNKLRVIKKYKEL